MKPFSVQPGDRVAYSVQWIKSVGQEHTSIAHARGIVTDVQELSPGGTVLATIKWEACDGHEGEFPTRVNVLNLAKVGPNVRYAAC